MNIRSLAEWIERRKNSRVLTSRRMDPVGDYLDFLSSLNFEPECRHVDIRIAGIPCTMLFYCYRYANVLGSIRQVLFYMTPAW